MQNAEVEEEQVDERSVDDLLTFINGGDEGKIKTSALFIAMNGEIKIPSIKLILLHMCCKYEVHNSFTLVLHRVETIFYEYLLVKTQGHVSPVFLSMLSYSVFQRSYFIWWFHVCGYATVIN